MKSGGMERARLVIVHDYCDSDDQCLPGEEVVAIILIWRGRSFWIPWGPTHLIVGNFLARHRWIALDSWQIAAKMRDDPFVQQHGMNAPGHKGRPARTSPAGARQQMKRMKDVLAALIVEYGLDISLDDILRTERTSTGTALYRIVADVSWEHWPLPGGEDALSHPHFPKVYPGVLAAQNIRRLEVRE
jgi:hypothetical protein